MTAAASDSRVGVIDHRRVVPVRPAIDVSAAGIAVFQSVTVAVDAGAGSWLGRYTVSVAGEGGKLTRRLP